MSLPKTDPADDSADEAPAVRAGQVHRYPVAQPNGSTRHQLVLILRDPDASGGVLAYPVCYEDQAAYIDPSAFATGTAEN